MTFTDSVWLHGTLALPNTVMSKALKANIFYSRGRLTQMLTESASASRWSSCPSCSVVSCLCTGRRCHQLSGYSWREKRLNPILEKLAQVDRRTLFHGTPTQQLRLCLRSEIYHADCRLVINELLSMSQPPGAITQHVRAILDSQIQQRCCHECLCWSIFIRAAGWLCGLVLISANLPLIQLALPLFQLRDIWPEYVDKYLIIRVYQQVPKPYKVSLYKLPHDNSTDDQQLRM